MQSASRKPKVNQGKLVEDLTTGQQEGSASLAYQKLLHIPLFQLHLLTKLDLSHNRLKQLPPEVSTLSHLEELNLTGNPIVELFETVGNLPKLRRLSLRRTGVMLLPRVEHLSRLEALSLADNGLTELPWVLPHLTNLTELDLSHNKLTPELIEILYTLAALRTLNLSYNGLVEYPQSLCIHLTDDYDLYQWNGLWPQKRPELQDVLAGSAATIIFPKLERLILTGNALTELPPFFQVTHVYLGGNQLTTIPSILWRKRGLTVLDLRNNAIQALHTDLKAREISYVNLSGNNLSHIYPKDWSLAHPLTVVCEFQNLRELNLSNCNLTTLPNEIAHLDTLEVLILDRNHFGMLNTNIAYLCNLQHLSVRYNLCSETRPHSKAMALYQLIGGQQLAHAFAALMNYVELSQDPELAALKALLLQVKKLDTVTLARCLALWESIQDLAVYDFLLEEVSNQYKSHLQQQIPLLIERDKAGNTPEDEDSDWDGLARNDRLEEQLNKGVTNDALRMYEDGQAWSAATQEAYTAVVPKRHQVLFTVKEHLKYLMWAIKLLGEKKMSYGVPFEVRPLSKL